MSIFDRLTARQILVFSEIMAESTLAQIEFLREKYLRSALNFDETVEFLNGLKLIDVQASQISPKSEFKAFLKRLGLSKQKEQLLRSFVAQVLFQKKNPFSGDVSQFMGYFKFKDNQYEFRPTKAVQRLQFSGLRNFLMDMEVIHLDPNTMKYVMNDDYYFSRVEITKNGGLSPEEFIEIEHKNRELGLKAELRIIEYEKERLSDFPNLIEKIVHVAKHDVSLGYDIRSYEVAPEEPEAIRLIEVKAVSLWNYRFNWTRNEIEVSRINRNEYYLYLLPVIKKDAFDLDNLKIIRDPYANVYNSKEWSRCCELLTLEAI